MHSEPGPSPRTVRLVRIPLDAMQALVEGDLARASTITGTPLSDYLASPECTWLWRIRLAQAVGDPASAHWVARAAVDTAGVVVGHAGFHGPPDPSGMVEMGYTVEPAWRRRGYARAMVRALLAWAAAEDGVTRVRASISPDNEASLATLRGFGFDQTGEQWDDEDGLELLFERAV